MRGGWHGDNDVHPDSGVPVGVTVPTLQVPVILPGGVAGTATVDVTVTAASGAVSATSSGSAPIRPPYEPENPPVIPAAGVDLSVDAPFTKVLAGRTSTQEIIVRNTGVTASTGPTTVRASLTGAAITAGNGAGWKCTADSADTNSAYTCIHPDGVAPGETLPAITLTTGVIASTSTRLEYRVSVSSPDTDAFVRDNETAAWPLVLDQVNLSLVKWALGTQNPITRETGMAPGSRVAYTLSPIVSPADAVLEGPVTISDPLPPGSTLVSAGSFYPWDTWSCVHDPAPAPSGTVRCTRDDGKVGAAVQIVVDLPPDKFSVGQVVTNTATISSGTPELTLNDNTAQHSMTLITPWTNLGITKESNKKYVGSGQINEGESFEWIITVKNTGTIPFTGQATVTDSAFSNLANVVVDSDWTCAAGKCVSTRPIPVGETLSPIRVKAQTTVGVTPDLLESHIPKGWHVYSIHNMATLSYPGDYRAFPQSVDAGQAVRILQDVAVEKSAVGPFFAGAGGGLVFPQAAQQVAGAEVWNTWRVTVRNKDSRHVYPTTITDTLPPGVTFTGVLGPLPAGWACRGTATGFACTTDLLDPNTSYSFLVVTRVDASVIAGTEITNKVVHGVPNDPVAGNDTAEATATVQAARADLVTRKLGPLYEDGRGYYSLNVRNVGPSPFDGAFVMTDLLPPLLTVDGPVTLTAGYEGSCVTTDVSGRAKVTCTVTDTPALAVDQTYEVGRIYFDVVSPGIVQIAENCFGLDWGTTVPPGAGQNSDFYTACTNGFTYDPSVKYLDLAYAKTVTPVVGAEVFDVGTVSLQSINTQADGSDWYVRPGEQVTYRLQVTNTGQEAWTSPVTLKDTLASGDYLDLAVVSVSPQPGVGWVCGDPSGFAAAASTPTLACSTDTDLPVGESFWVELTVKSGSARGLVNTVQPTDPLTDSNSFNNSASITLAPVPPTDLGVVKSLQVKQPSGTLLEIAEGAMIPARGSGQWTIRVRSAATVTTTPIVVTDTLPAGFTVTGARSTGGLTFVCATTGEATTGQTVTCTYDSHEFVRLLSPKSATDSRPRVTDIVLDVSWSLPSGQFTNTATVTGEGETTPDVLPSTDTFTVNVPPIDAAMRKMSLASGPVPVGGDIPFSLVVDNIGADAITGPVQVVDTIPSGLSFVSATGLGWTCSSNGATPPVVTCVSESDIPSGASSTPIIIITRPLQFPISGAAATNKAVVTVAGDGNPANNTANVVVSSATGRAFDDLQVRTLLGGRILPGQAVTWDVSMSNIGQRVVNGTIELTIRVPNGLTPTGAVGDGWTCTITGQVLVCHNDTDAVPGVLYPGLAVQLLAASDLDGTEVFVLTAMLGADGLVDKNVSNNQADEIALSELVPVSAVELSKLTNGVDVFPADMPALTVGQQVTWSYLVSNIGNQPLSDVKVIDDKEGAITCPKETLEVNETMVCTATGTAVEGTYVNSATVTATVHVMNTVQHVEDHDASGYTATAAPPLPATGANSGSTVLWGFGLVIGGALLLAGTRRRRTAHS